jgi:Tfp pilus assembly protein PilX
MDRLYSKKVYRIRGREEGIAMLTVLMLTIILTVIGIAAITTTSLDLWMAGGERVRESVVASEEACISSGVAIIQQVLENAALPAVLQTAGANPFIPALGVPPANNALVAKIMAQFEGQPDPDTANPALIGTAPYSPNAILSVPTAAAPVYRVNMDIDRLYKRHVVGGPAEFGEGVNIEILYRITCYAWTPTAAGAVKAAPTLATDVSAVMGNISAVYVCYMRGPDRCQRQNIQISS